MKPNPDNGVDVLHKNIDIIEGHQKHFDTMAKYISDGVFVSITAFMQQPELRDITVRFIISLGLLLDPVLPS